MADNIYLLETRLSKAQQTALTTVRDAARMRGFTVFLVGGAVRDLIGGGAIRDLDVVVQGSAPKLKKDLEKTGAAITGELESGQLFFARFPGGVRMEIGSTVTVTYPKPGKAVTKPATILDDLRRRDFTANAMALSLNEGSYGLLMDPLNGVADIENRELRLVSNYGFIEDPVRMIRAARFMARLGWRMDEKTQARYETGKAEGYISAMDQFHRGYEIEEIFHEEDALRVIRRLEEEGWMSHLAPALSAANANVAELERLRESQSQLQIQGVIADAAAANFPLLTAKMGSKDVEALKKGFPRQGFVAEIESLESKGKEFAAQLAGKGAALPSQAYRLMTSAEPELVLWAAHTTKSAALQAKFRSFYTEWPQARQKVPYLQMQEMRITPDLPQYEELVENLFFELMNGKLLTAEEIKAYLEPYSPPAPPPPVSLRRPRAPKKESKAAKNRKKAADQAEAMDATTSEGTEGTPVDGTTLVAEKSAEQGGVLTEIAVDEVKSAETGVLAPKVSRSSRAPKEGVARPGDRSSKVAPDSQKPLPKESRPETKPGAAKSVAVKSQEPARKSPPAKSSGKQKAAKNIAGKQASRKPGAKQETTKQKTAATSPAKKAAGPAKTAAPSKSAKKAAPVKSGSGAKGGVKRAAAKAPAKKTAAKGPGSSKKADAKKKR